jgi:hypothetical protein
MSHRKFATPKALIDYAEEKGLVYVWENGGCVRVASPVLSLDYRRSDARIVENGFAASSGGVSKSAKVVLVELVNGL